MKKALAILGTWALAVGGLVTITASSGSAQIFTGTNQFQGYSTGTGIFADLLQSGPNPPLTTTASRLLDANVGFSGAAADTKGLANFVATAPNGGSNEMNLAVVPDGGIAVPPSPNQNSRNTYARGSGLDAGIGTPVPNNPDVNQIIIAGLAEQAAAPQTPSCTSPPQTCGPGNEIIKQVGPIPGDPLIYADLLRGEALAQFKPDACDPSDSPAATGGIQDITKDLAFGLGRAAKVQLLDQGAALPDGSMSQPTISLEAPPGGPPQDTVVQSKSFTFLTPNGDGTFGLTSETIQSMAPVSLNLGGSILTVEIGGPWILRSTATGKATGSEIHLGPADAASPTTLLITFTPPGMPTQTILKTQDIFSDTQIPTHITIPPGPLPHLAEINIGESPRAIGAFDNTVDPPPGPTVTPTLVSGADDVVRVRLLVQDPITHVADIRVGHIESRAQVPSGGITCNTPGTTPTTPTTGPGGTTPTTTGSVGNPTTTKPKSGTVGGITTTTTKTGTVGGPRPTVPALRVTPTTAPAQVLATTFAQTPTAGAQNQQPNFTG